MHPLVKLFYRLRLSQPVLALCLTAMFAGTPLSTASANEKLADFLELRGYIRIGGVLEFSVYNKRDNRSEWLRVKEKHRGYTIESYDGERNEILISYNGMSGLLPLQASQIADYVETTAASGQPGQSGNKSPAARGSGTQEALLASAQPRSTPGRGAPQLRAAAGAVAGNRAAVSRDNPTPTGGFSSGRGHSRPPAPPPAPQTPPANGQPPATGEPQPGGTGLNDPYWDSMQSPPPVPSSTPPVYSPEA